MDVGVVLCRNSWSTPEVMFGEALDDTSDAFWFVRWCCTLRQGWWKLEADDLLNSFIQATTNVTSHPSVQYRKVYSCMKAFFLAYLNLRFIASPRNKRPVFNNKLNVLGMIHQELSSIGLLPEMSRASRTKPLET